MVDLLVESYPRRGGVNKLIFQKNTHTQLEKYQNDAEMNSHK